MRNQRPIAILMATYNGEKYLSQQIESLLAQTYGDWTLYIRDDGSTDATPAIIRDYCARYPQIVCLEDGDGNLGCRDNFFRLLEAVDSDYYMFCDEDDVWYPDKIEISWNRMRQVETACPDRPVVVHTDSAICDAELNILAESYWKNARFNPENFFTYNQLAVSPCVEGATMLFNRRAREISFPVASHSSMYDAWIALRVLKYKGILSSIHTPTRLYRQHDRNFYGIPTSPRSPIEKLRKKWRISVLNATYLKNGGWGGYCKYAWFALYVSLKKNLLRLNSHTD